MTRKIKFFLKTFSNKKYFEKYFSKIKTFIYLNSFNQNNHTSRGDKQMAKKRRKAAKRKKAKRSSKRKKKRKR